MSIGIWISSKVKFYNELKTLFTVFTVAEELTWWYILKVLISLCPVILIMILSATPAFLKIVTKVLRAVCVVIRSQNGFMNRVWSTPFVRENSTSCTNPNFRIIFFIALFCSWLVLKGKSKLYFCNISNAILYNGISLAGLEW